MKQAINKAAYTKIILINGKPLLLYIKPGIPSAMPILMLHGHGGDHSGLIKLSAQFEEIVVVPDLPGFGLSEDLSDHSMLAYIEVLQELVSQLEFAQGYVLLGHSLGSAVALSLAGKDERVKKLILINAIPEFNIIIRRMLTIVAGTAGKLPKKLAHSLIHAGMYNLSTFLLHSRRRKDLGHAFAYMKSQGNTKYSLKAWQETGNAIYEMDQFAAAKTVSVPTLLIHGEKDRMTSLVAVESFAGHFKNAEVKSIAEGGHFLQIENVERTANIIKDFLV